MASSSLGNIILIMIFGEYMHVVLIILVQSVVGVVHWRSGMVCDKLSSCQMWLIATLTQELNAIIKEPIVPLSYGLLIKLVRTINHHKKPILYWYQLLSVEDQVHKHTHTQLKTLTYKSALLTGGVFYWFFQTKVNEGILNNQRNDHIKIIKVFFKSF